MHSRHRLPPVNGALNSRLDDNSFRLWFLSVNSFRLYRECAGDGGESRVSLTAGALPIQRIELSRYQKAYGDWFPNCRLAGGYFWRGGPMFRGGIRRCLPPYSGGLTARAVFTGTDESAGHTSAVPPAGSSVMVRNVTDNHHQAMRSPTPGLPGTALLLSWAGAPGRSHADGQLCRLGRVDGAAPLS